MRLLRVRVELNKGRKGIPMHKLAAITDEVQRFFLRVGIDLGIETPRDQWLAVNFKNGSLSYDAEYQGVLPEVRLHEYNEELARLARLPLEGPQPPTRLSHTTILQFTKITESIDEDEKVRFGLYTNGDRKPGEWYSVTKSLSRQIAQTVVATSQYRGVVQGVLHSWFKETSPAYFNLRESVTGRIVKCFYSKTDYSQIVKLLERKNAIIQVIGMVTANLFDRKIEEVHAERFAIAEELSDEDFEKFFGLAPDLTGDLTTEEYVSAVREFND